MPCDICICRCGYTVSAEVLSDPRCTLRVEFCETFLYRKPNFCERILGEILRKILYIYVQRL